jgi:hypothetical protein
LVACLYYFPSYVKRDIVPTKVWLAVCIISQAFLKEILYQQKVRLAVCIISQAILKEILYQQRFGWLFVLYPKLS